MANSITVRILGDAKKFQRSIGEAESSIGRFSKTAKLASAAVAGAFVAVGAGAFRLGQSFDEQFDKIRIGTGATGTALDSLQDDFKEVLKSGPFAFDQVGTAIADLNTRLGLSGQPLQELSEQVLNLSRITGTDAATNIDRLTRVLNDAGIAQEDFAGTTDLLFRATQASGISFDELSGNLVQYGAATRNLGFSLEESTALFALFNKAGVNTETVFSGLRQSVGRLAKAGEDVPETFRRIVGEITELGPGTEATAKAIELFGQRAGPDLVDTITGGKFAIDDFLATLENGGDTINGVALETESWGEKLTRLKNQVLVPLEPLATFVFEGIGRVIEAVTPPIAALTEALAERLPGAIQRVRDGLGRLADFIPNLGFDLGLDFSSLEGFADSVIDFLQPVIDFVRDVWPGVSTFILGALQVVRDWIEENWPPVRDFILGVLEAVRLWIEENWPPVREFVLGVFRAVRNWIEENWPKFQAAVLVVFEAIRLWVEENWPKIQQIILNVFEILAAVIPPIVKGLTVLITGFWRRYGDEVTFILGAAAGAIVAAFKFVARQVSLVLTIIEGVTSAFRYLVTTDFETVKADVTRIVKELVAEVVGFFESLPGRILEALGNMRNLLPGAGTDVIDGFWDGLKARWEDVKRWFRSITNQIPDFKGPPEKDRTLLLDAGRLVMGGFETGLRDKFADVEKFLSGVGPSLDIGPVERYANASSNRPTGNGFAGPGRGPAVVVETWNQIPQREAYQDVLLLTQALG